MTNELTKRVAVLLGRPLTQAEYVVVQLFIKALKEQYVVVAKPLVHESVPVLAADLKVGGWFVMETGSGLPAARKKSLPSDPKPKSKSEAMAELLAIVEQRSDELLTTKKTTKYQELSGKPLKDMTID